MADEDDDIEAAIDDAATAPKKITGDTGSTEAHPLPDLIEADRYRKQQRASRRGFGGLKFFKLIPPGQD